MPSTELVARAVAPEDQRAPQDLRLVERREAGVAAADKPVARVAMQSAARAGPGEVAPGAVRAVPAAWPPEEPAVLPDAPAVPVAERWGAPVVPAARPSTVRVAAPVDKGARAVRPVGAGREEPAVKVARAVKAAVVGKVAVAAKVEAADPDSAGNDA